MSDLMSSGVSVDARLPGECILADSFQQEPQLRKGHIGEVASLQAQNAEFGVLSVLREMLEGVKEIHKDTKDIRDQNRDEIQGVRYDVDELRQEVNDLRRESDYAYQEASNVRYLVEEVHESLDNLRLKHEGSNDYHNHNDENPNGNSQGGESPRSSTQQVLEPLKETLNYSDQQIDSGVSSSSGLGGSSGNNKSSLSDIGAAADANEQPAEAEAPTETPKFDPEDPNNLKAVDDHHLDEFRASMVKVEELATRFNKLPSDVFSKLDEEVSLESKSY
jgi:chromosome segregation ATPase